MRRISILFFVIVLLFSCETRKYVSVLNYSEPTTEKVEVLGAGQIVPEGAILIGNVTVGDTGFTSSGNCTYAKVIQDATTVAQQMGGNVIYIVSHRTPDSNSTCHRINVNVYKVEK